MSNRFGYVVGSIRLDPTSRSKNAPALGRLRHEKCRIDHRFNGHVVVYLGDERTAASFVKSFVGLSIRYFSGGSIIVTLLEEREHCLLPRFHDNESW